MAALAKARADFIMKFGRERAFADAGCVGFDNAEHIADSAWPEPGARRRLPRHRIRRGNEGISAVIDIEQNALRPFKQNAFAGAARFIKQTPDGLRERRDLRRKVFQLCDKRIGVHFRRAMAASQRIMVYKEVIDFRCECFRIAQIANAQRPPAGAILVSRANAALCCADLGAAVRGFAHLIEFLMHGENERCVLGDGEIVGRDGHSLPAKALNLGKERDRIDNDTGADNALAALADDAGRQQRELVDIPIDNERMARIVAALKAHDDVRPRRQPVHNLALALVAPLGADDRHIRHDPILLLKAGRNIAARACGSNAKRLSSGGLAN